MTAPAQYLDVQVNGYAGVDFNDAASSDDDWHRACERLRADGMAGILATVITDGVEIMGARLARIVEVRRRDPLVREMVWGLHVEGPFIDAHPGYVGAHPPQHARPADLDATRRLLEAGDGLVRIVTLAPEHDAGLRVTRFLAEQGIVVSGGHCNPSLDQLCAAIDAGLSMFTHLGNGCPMQLHRHDNIIQRVLSQADRLWISFIADGAHVNFFALGNYLRLVGPERAIITTDAMSAAGCGPGRYTIGSRVVEIGDDLVAWGPNRAHLVGSAITMPVVVKNLREQLGLSDEFVERLVHGNARRLLHREPAAQVRGV